MSRTPTPTTTKRAAAPSLPKRLKRTRTGHHNPCKRKPTDVIEEFPLMQESALVHGYQLIGLLKGSQNPVKCTVFTAQHTKDLTIHVIKMIHRTYNFYREALMLQALLNDTSNRISFLDNKTNQPSLQMLVMPKIPGDDGYTFISRTTFNTDPINYPRYLTNFVIHVMNAAFNLHRRGFIHGDLSLANVIVERTLDFFDREIRKITFIDAEHMTTVGGTIKVTSQPAGSTYWSHDRCGKTTGQKPVIAKKEHDFISFFCSLLCHGTGKTNQDTPRKELIILMAEHCKILAGIDTKIASTKEQFSIDFSQVHRDIISELAANPKPAFDYPANDGDDFLTLLGPL